MNKQVFEDFHSKLTSKNLQNNNVFEKEITIHYFEILEILATDFETYRKFSPLILSTLEDNDRKSISYSLFIFFDLFEKLTSQSNVYKLDQSVTKAEITDESNSKFLNLLEKSLKINNQLRISDFEFPPNDLAELEIKEIISLQISIIQESAKEIDWKEEQSDNIMLQLPILRHLLVRLNNPELFYFIIGIFIDRLNSSEFYQAARDVSEEIIISSFNDDYPQFGFFNAFRCYSAQGSAQTSLLYANISMHLVLKNEQGVSDKYLQELIWQSIKYFRNTGLYPYAVKIYKSIPKTLEFSGYHRRSIDHSYFTSLIPMEKEKLPDLLLDYLNKERENIFSGGVHESLPWLITLYNVRRIFPNANFSLTGLGYYLNIFEQIVPKESISNYKNIIDGNSSSLKEQLKKSLIKLNETRNKSDIVYDNDMSLKIANRIIEDSFAKKDSEAILLAMMIKSDFSLIFKSKESFEFAPFKVPTTELKKFNKIYSERDKIESEISKNEFQSTFWLAITEGKVFQLAFRNKSFQYFELTQWDWSKFKSLTNGEYFSNFSFDDTVKDKGGVRNVYEEEHFEQAKKINDELSFSKLNIDDDTDSIYLIKDMELADFPHNLFLNQNGEFLHLSKPITNILSTEWYLSVDKSTSINKNYSKSIWIPKEEGDFTLNQLYAKIENNLTENNFDINTKLEKDSSITSDINIICSHGAKDIAEKQIIYPSERPLINLNKVIGEGEVLIFLICHSGSYKSELFKNNITSLVKTYIEKGYKAIIAPFWGLHINVPEIWLPEFLSSFNNGDSIDIALFKANKKVYAKYPTPAAWCAMHLYGNPNLKVEQ
ncbi:hypothetical protein [Seonamhaeicola sp.]|uniref:hypothetical protein n=1 Tax=Seonamhaeicola sp. TaxID=1912245 RepID=UPI0026161F24|nr:hypothetical protein [Seonamhaeicola sp.]